MSHVPDAPARPAMPSLLRSLLSDHLDPGYAAAAAARTRSRRPAGDRLWQALAALLIAAVFAVAVAAARSISPGVSAAQQGLATGVRAAQDRTAQLADRRDELSAQADAVQRSALTADATGRTLLAELDGISLSAATTAVEGPGLQIVATEPGPGPDLTDVSKQRVPGTGQVILDRDLQLVVNALWAAGAEAIAVGGVRIGPGVTIRQAGGAILVDNQPVAGPYRVLAIGAPQRLADSFGASPALQRLRLLEAAYRVGVTVSVAEDLTLPPAAARDVKFGRRDGS